jgi:hypothetical protein
MEDIGDNAVGPQMLYETSHYRLDAANGGKKGWGDVEDSHS